MVTIALKCTVVGLGHSWSRQTDGQHCLMLPVVDDTCIAVENGRLALDAVWTSLQWALHTRRASPFSAMTGVDMALPKLF